MAATKDNPIVFFDIMAQAGPWSPNTWKTRLALNYRRLPYRVEYVSIPDIESTFKKFGVSPTSNKAPQYTLPMIADPSGEPNGKPIYIADSFKIALYLDDKYPSPKYPNLFPPGTRAFHGLFVEKLPSVTYSLGPRMVPLVGRHGFLDERGEEYYRNMHQERAGKSFAQIAEEGIRSWPDVREKWDTFGKLLDLNDSGPFVMGEQVSYADLMLGAAFCWVKAAEGGNTEIWKEMSEWQHGRWGDLWKGVEKIIGDPSELL